MSITCINEFQAAEGKTEELYRFLTSLMSYISTSEGCHSCEVLRNIEIDNAFVVIEKWDSIDLHKKSLDNYPKSKMQSAMLLFGAPPKGGYFSK